MLIPFNFFFLGQNEIVYTIMASIILFQIISYCFSKKKTYYYYRELPFNEGPVLLSHFLEDIKITNDDNEIAKPKLEEFLVFANQQIGAYQLYWQISANQLPFSYDYLQNPKTWETTVYPCKEIILKKIIKYFTVQDIKLITLGFFNNEPLVISNELLKNEVINLWNLTQKNNKVH